MSDAFPFFVPVLTLVDDQYEPLPGLIETHLNWLKRQGVEGILVMGTTGEFPNFTTEQRKRYLKTVLRYNPELSVMVNIGVASIVDAFALQHHALETGKIDSVMWMPPFYFPEAQVNGLINCAAKLLELQPESIPFYAYHYPKMSKVNICVSLLETFPRIRGLKDSTGEFERIGQLVKTFPDREIFVGTDVAIPQAMALGCHGVISALGNIFPALIRETISGNEASLQTLRALRQVLDRYCKLPALKAYLNHLKLSSESAVMTLPFIDLPGTTQIALCTEIEGILHEQAVSS